MSLFELKNTEYSPVMPTYNVGWCFRYFMYLIIFYFPFMPGLSAPLLPVIHGLKLESLSGELCSKQPYFNILYFHRPEELLSAFVKIREGTSFKCLDILLQGAKIFVVIFFYFFVVLIR